MVERYKKAPLVACSDKETAAYVADACDRIAAIVEQMVTSDFGFANPYANESEDPYLYPHDPEKGCPWCGSNIPSDEGTCGSCGRHA